MCVQVILYLHFVCVIEAINRHQLQAIMVPPLGGPTAGMSAPMSLWDSPGAGDVFSWSAHQCKALRHHTFAKQRQGGKGEITKGMDMFNMF